MQGGSFVPLQVCTVLTRFSQHIGHNARISPHPEEILPCLVNKQQYLQIRCRPQLLRSARALGVMNTWVMMHRSPFCIFSDVWQLGTMQVGASIKRALRGTSKQRRKLLRHTVILSIVKVSKKGATFHHTYSHGHAWVVTPVVLNLRLLIHWATSSHKVPLALSNWQLLRCIRH